MGVALVVGGWVGDVWSSGDGDDMMLLWLMGWMSGDDDDIHLLHLFISRSTELVT